MQYVYQTYGDAIYSNLKEYKQEILDWCEKQELNLSSANKKKLTQEATWKKHLKQVELAKKLQPHFADEVFTDFNAFTKEVNRVIKSEKLDTSASEKKAVLQAVSWYDAEAEKVIKKKEKINGAKLEKVLAHLGCTKDQLTDFGYYPTAKADEYIVYETESDLRDTENVPLKENIHAYFVREVQPHVSEAWINLDATKIGYEISFNKYFYKHTPLRSIEEVTNDILALEHKSDGLISEILNLA